MRRLPDGYDTLVADAPRSGGESQRLGLARAFAHGGRLLILDDALSSLDTVTEARIAEALVNGGAGGTRLLVAHRTATAARADAVAWLDGGRVRAVGPHEELWRAAEYRAVFGSGPERTDGWDGGRHEPRPGRAPRPRSAARRRPGTVTDGIHARGLRFLRARWRVLVRLGGWSVLETAQTFLTGYAPARALDEGFLAGRPGVGLAWLGVAGIGVLVGAWGTVRVYAAVAALVEPLRDVLVGRVVERGVREADTGALSGLTQQVEIARDTFAGLVMVSRSFVFTAVGAVVGLASLDPLLLLVVVPPLAAGLGLFAATLRPLARRQEEYLVADEALAEGLGRVCPGLRDITAAGAEDRVAAGTGRLVDTEQRAAYSLARWSVLRVVSSPSAASSRSSSSSPARPGS